MNLMGNTTHFVGKNLCWSVQTGPSLTETHLGTAENIL